MFGADGETLMVLRPESPSISGWEPDWLFFQPRLEEALDAAARSHAGVAWSAAGWPRGSSRTASGATVTVRRVEELEPGVTSATDETRRVRGALRGRR